MSIASKSDDDAPLLTSDDIACLGMRKVDPPFGDLFRDLEYGALFAAAKIPWGRPQRRPRRPPLARLIAEAEKAGRQVTSITRDGVTYTFGQAEQLTDTDRELAEFEARHAKA